MENRPYITWFKVLDNLSDRLWMTKGIDAVRQFKNSLKLYRDKVESFHIEKLVESSLKSHPGEER